MSEGEKDAGGAAAKDEAGKTEGTAGGEATEKGADTGAADKAKEGGEEGGEEKAAEEGEGGGEGGGEGEEEGKSELPEEDEEENEEGMEELGEEEDVSGEEEGEEVQGGEEDEDEEGEDEHAEPTVEEAAKATAGEAVESIAQQAGAGKVLKLEGVDELDVAGGLVPMELAVLLTAVVAEAEEVPDEDRTRYVWEGSCSSSSEEEAKKKKRARLRLDGEDAGEESDEDWEEGAAEESFSREDALVEYRSLADQMPLLVKKNTLLQKKIYEYCKKRKMEVYFDEVERPDPKMQTKYLRQLDAYDEHLRESVRTRAYWQEALQQLEVQKTERVNAMRQMLQHLLEEERGVGFALLSSTTGKPLQDKAVEKLLQRQEALVLDLHAVRLKFIHLRNALALNEALMKRLETDTLGEGLYLLDYEQLRMENQSYSDKIEERDEELTRLRNKATASIQQLAHIREKANATAANITDLYDRLEQIDRLANDTREDMGRRKVERDTLRLQYQGLRKQAGLLVHKRLLRDFERSLERSDAMGDELTHLKAMHARQHKRLTRIKDTLKDLQKEGVGTGYSGRSRDTSSTYDVYRTMLAEKRRTRLPTTVPSGAEARGRVQSIKPEKADSSLFRQPRLLYAPGKRRPTN